MSPAASIIKSEPEVNVIVPKVSSYILGVLTDVPTTTVSDTSNDPNTSKLLLNVPSPVTSRLPPTLASTVTDNPEVVSVLLIVLQVNSSPTSSTVLPLAG